MGTGWPGVGPAPARGKGGAAGGGRGAAGGEGLGGRPHGPPVDGDVGDGRGPGSLHLLHPGRDAVGRAVHLTGRQVQRLGNLKALEVANPNGFLPDVSPDTPVNDLLYGHLLDRSGGHRNGRHFINSF